MMTNPFKTFALLTLIALASSPVSTAFGQSSPDLSKSLRIDHRYLNLPVEAGVKPQHVKLSVEGRVIREFSIQLAETAPDYWVHVDMAEFLGKEAGLQLERATNKGLSSVYFSDQFAGHDSLYRERLRPQFHFTTQRGWNNDPNGLVYLDGEYHLYYQHNPFGTNWGNMHWGHAVSPDLVHWRELGTALYPVNYEDMAYSGSAVIDTKNTSGFGENGQPPLVVAYTSTGRGESIVYSLDKGRTFREYANNPVIKHVGRDPKIFWYEPGQNWVMALYDETPVKNSEGLEYNRRTIQLHTSPDLKKWTYQSELEGFFECPEFFELAVDGDAARKKWVMYGANGQYRIGSFDGKTFTPETPKYQIQHGNYYASQTYNNTPDGRRIQVSWGRGIQSPGMPFNQLMLFPTELSLATVDDGVRMLPKPIREIELLHQKKHEWKDITLRKNEGFETGVKSDLLHIEAEFELFDDFDFGLVVNGYKVEYNALDYKLNGVFVRPMGNKLKLEILADRTSIEIFVNDGRAYIPKAHIPSQGELGVKAYAFSPNWQDENMTSLRHLVVYELDSIWR